MFFYLWAFYLIAQSTAENHHHLNQNYDGLHTNSGGTQYEPAAESSIQHDSLSHVGHNFINDYGVHEEEGHGGNSHGAELASLAHTSAVQANNAVQNQHTAGNQAAFGIKSSLASAAIGNAHAAQAALAGKRALVNNLRHQLSEAQQRLHGEISLYQRSEAAAQAARETAQQAQTQVATLGAAVAAAQGGATHAGQAAGDAAQAAATQHAMVAEAKERVSRLLSQIEGALSQLHDTESSAQKAHEAAHTAQSNAAAAAAAIGSSAGGHHVGGGSDYPIGGSHHNY